MEQEKNCPFCDVKRSGVIRSGELFTSLLSTPRLRKGHALVVPTRHVEKPMDLRPDEIAVIYAEIQRLQGRILDSELGQGCDTWQKYQPFVPQGRVKVDHVHFHVLPRNPQDRLFMTPEESQWDEFTLPSDNEINEVLDILR
jgi:diadenosine tetraphosphate (Ap4A) HIT family hydrolase